jgi:hypothetical protein
MDQLKSAIWGDNEVIFHSRDIRKCEKRFQKLFDPEVKNFFYEELNKIISDSSYFIIAAAIQKDLFIENFGRTQRDIYEIALSFVMEQAVLTLWGLPGSADLSVVIERRGKKEDQLLYNHFQLITSKGAGMVTAADIHDHDLSITFRNKMENINGLQLADLVAYPIARQVIEPHKSNLAYQVLQSKIYQKNGQLHGLRVFP